MYKIFLNKKKYNKNSSYDSHKLIINEKVRSSYQKKMRQNLRIMENNKWEEIQQTIRDTAEAIIGFTKTTKNPNRLYNEEVEKLSIKQKNLRLEICNCNNIEHLKVLKKERNRLLHLIREKVKEIKEEQLNAKLIEINKIRGD